MYISSFASSARQREPGREPGYRQYLGLALIPQAGVSIGLAILAQRLLPSTEGTMLSLIILSSAVLYEMIGPACAKLSLKLSGSIAIENTKEKTTFHHAKVL